MTSVRLAAARVLVAVARGRGTLAAEVERARQGVADERDRGLLLELTAGVLRWQAELDAVLTPCSRRPLADLDAPILAALRLAVYQLRHLDRVPVHAIVNESVEVAKTLATTRAAGFVNGLLRTYLRRAATIRLPSRPGPNATRAERILYLSTTCSHPAWLAGRWIDRYGFDDAEAWCQFNNRPPELAVRARSPRYDAVTLLAGVNVPAVRGRYAHEMARLAPGALGRLPAAVRAELVVQDEASVLVAHAVGAAHGERVLDVCAAPGGKSAVLWSDMGADGVLVSSDLRPNRLRVLRSTLAERGVPPRIVALDAARALPFGTVFDRVLVDAPCSGLGTLSRDPDAKWSVTEASLATLARAQRSMLSHAAAVVRPGGALVYATCSSEPEENDEVVDAFLAERLEFTEAEITSPVADGRRLRTLPFRHGLDAFFAAVLVRRQSV